MYINNICNGKNNILIKRIISSLSVLLLTLLYTSCLLAEENIDSSVTMVSYENGDIELTASCFFTRSESLIVFLPSVYAPPEEQQALTREIANNGLSACFSHVFTDLFLPMERKFYDEIPLDHMLSLLGKIQAQSQKAIFFVGHGSGNRLVYKLANLSLQTSNNSPPLLSGLILLSPNLLSDTPAPGKNQQYMPLVDKKTLPVFIFQPSYSPHHWHLDTLIDRITQSGTFVRFQRLADVRDGYALRGNRNKKEQALREQATALFEHAIKQLTGRN
jgi:hypothetical protein